MGLKQRTGVRLASATYHQLRGPDRFKRVRLLAEVWTAMAGTEAIAQRPPAQIWPGIEAVTAQVRLSKHGWELSPAEQLILDAVVRFKAPATIFEFGTFAGSATVLLADAAPGGATVHTIDLPDDYMAGAEWFSPDLVGREFRDKPEYESTIVQHRADLAHFDVTPFRSAVDLVFVDDGHTYEDVTRDSLFALQMLAPGGCIIWDDYGPPHTGSIRALNELSTRIPLARVQGTRFVDSSRMSGG